MVKTRNAENNGAGAGEGGDSDSSGWFEAGKKGKPSKKVRFICRGGDEVCDKEIGAKEKCIECEACMEWFHPKCQDLSERAFDAIDEFKLFWICKRCHERMRDVLDTGRKLEACVEMAEKRITKAVMETKRQTADEMLKQTEDQLKRMQEQVAEQMQSTSVMLKKAVQKQEKEGERAKNLIIFGLKESSKEDPSEKKEEDKMNITELSKAVCGEEVDLKILDIVRLGKKGEDRSASASEKPRLILVKFETKDDADKLFRKRFGLKDAGHTNVYVNRDVSKEEREIQYKLREELKRKGRETHRIFQGRVIPRDQ